MIPEKLIGLATSLVQLAGGGYRPNLHMTQDSEDTDMSTTRAIAIIITLSAASTAMLAHWWPTRAIAAAAAAVAAITVVRAGRAHD